MAPGEPPLRVRVRLLLLLLLVLLCVRPGAGDATDDCVACRFTFGYSYEFFAGHHVEVRNTPDRRYFPTNGLSPSCSVATAAMTRVMMTTPFAHTQTGLSYQFWMFPYDVTSGRVQSIIGNLFAKSETLQFYNTGFYLHYNRLMFVSGPLDFGPEANCLFSFSLLPSVLTPPSVHTEITVLD